MLAIVFLGIAVLVRVFGTFSTLGFVPLNAALLYFGFRMPRKYFWAPVAALAALDVYLTTVKYGMTLQWDQTLIWASYLGACFLGSLLRGRSTKILYLAGASLSASIAFFLISNLGVWLSWQMYPPTFSGLAACYINALPFFRNGVAGDLIFTAVFFGISIAVEHFSRSAAHNRSAAI